MDKSIHEVSIVVCRATMEPKKFLKSIRAKDKLDKTTMFLGKNKRNEVPEHIGNHYKFKRSIRGKRI